MKWCSGCNRIQPDSNFGKRSSNKDGLRFQCKDCYGEKRREYYNNNKDKWLNTKTRERGKLRKRELRAERRLEVLTHYGGYPPVCACCDEDIYEFLTIHHIHGGGNVHRREIGIGLKSGVFLYKWLIDNNFPKGFQVFCWNCNCGSRMNDGVCPHKRNI